MMKINVVGTSGSGKSTVGKQIAEHFSLPYLEMDQLFWKPNWVMSTDDEFFSKLTLALEDKPCWVLDGNYTRTAAIKWQDIDMVVWVDYSFIRTFYQATKRALSRTFNKTELWPNTNNKESFQRLFSHDSILLWTIKTYHSNKQKYHNIMHNPDYAHIQFIRISSPPQISAVLTQLGELNQRL